MTTPRVAVCVPCNGESHAQMLPSVMTNMMSQQLKPAEVSVSISGISQEMYDEVIAKCHSILTDIQLITCHSTLPILEAKNRNTAVANTSSDIDIISFRDADDDFRSDWLYRTSQLLQEYNADMCLIGFVLPPRPHPRPGVTINKWRQNVPIKIITPEEIKKICGERLHGPLPINPLAHGWSTFKRHVFDNIKFDESMTSRRGRGIDCRFVRQVIQDHPVVYTSEQLGVYNIELSSYKNR